MDLVPAFAILVASGVAYTAVSGVRALAAAAKPDVENGVAPPSAFRIAAGLVADLRPEDEQCRDLGEALKDALHAHETGDVALAESRYKRVLQLSKAEDTETDDNRLNLASAYHGMGLLAQRREDYEGARMFYFKCLETAVSISNFRVISPTIHQLGVIEQESGNPQEAARFYYLALELFDKAGAPELSAPTWHQLGVLANERHQEDVAEGYYNEALQIYETSSTGPSVIQRWGKANVYQQKATVREKQGRLIEAVDFYSKASEMFSEIGDNISQMKCDRHARRLSLENNILSRSRRFAERASSLKRALVVALNS